MRGGFEMDCAFFRQYCFQTDVLGNTTNTKPLRRHLVLSVTPSY